MPKRPGPIGSHPTLTWDDWTDEITTTILGMTNVRTGMLLRSLAWAHARSGRGELVDRILARAPAGVAADLYRARALAYAHAGDPESARTQLSRAEESDVGDDDLLAMEASEHQLWVQHAIGDARVPQTMARLEAAQPGESPRAAVARVVRVRCAVGDLAGAMDAWRRGRPLSLGEVGRFARALARAGREDELAAVLADGVVDTDVVLEAVAARRPLDVVLARAFLPSAPRSLVGCAVEALLRAERDAEARALLEASSARPDATRGRADAAALALVWARLGELERARAIVPDVGQAALDAAEEAARVGPSLAFAGGAVSPWCALTIRVGAIVGVDHAIDRVSGGTDEGLAERRAIRSVVARWIAIAAMPAEVRVHELAALLASVRRERAHLQGMLRVVTYAAMALGAHHVAAESIAAMVVGNRQPVLLATLAVAYVRAGDLEGARRVVALQKGVNALEAAFATLEASAA
jgi:hypothetical protein